MSPATAIYNLLKDSSAVGALIGDKIYPGIIPGNVNYPAVRYSELEQRRIKTKDGPIETNEHTFDLDVYASQYDKAQSIAQAIKVLLNWYTGTVNTVVIKRIELLDQSDANYEDDKDLFHITQVYSIRAIS